ncbi:unnamed protein product [Aphis gossypii]|uniref:Uncharacterized protein n=1 Tax=Aphis gossypii TaxID=80765 RepID=A0A9P0IWP1_APHGO|nr:unnamed protein product [Aphis gossypii]
MIILSFAGGVNNGAKNIVASRTKYYIIEYIDRVKILIMFYLYFILVRSSFAVTDIYDRGLERRRLCVRRQRRWRRRCAVGTRIVGQAEDTHADGDKRYGRRAQHDRRARTTGRDERTHIRGRLRRRHTRPYTLTHVRTHTHTGARENTLWRRENARHERSVR